MSKKQEIKMNEDMLLKFAHTDPKYEEYPNNRNVPAHPFLTNTVEGPMDKEVKGMRTQRQTETIKSPKDSQFPVDMIHLNIHSL